MKKRILALALSLVLLLSLVPFALAADTADPEIVYNLDSRLLGYGYIMDDSEKEIAVGDVLSVHYAGSAAATLYCNGEKVFDYTAGSEDYEYCNIPATKTGTLELSLRQGDSEIAHRTFTVIASKDMYPKIVKRAFAEFFSTRINPFVSVDELKDAGSHGFPVGNPFLPAEAFVTGQSVLTYAVFSLIGSAW